EQSQLGDKRNQHPEEGERHRQPLPSRGQEHVHNQDDQDRRTERDLGRERVVVDHAPNRCAIPWTALSVEPKTKRGNTPRRRIPTRRGTHETHSTASMSRRPCSFHLSGRTPMFTRWSIHRK